MKKISILLMIVGIAITVWLVIYYKDVVNPVDSDTMTITHGGSMTAKWPIFIGIIFTFVGGLFYYVSSSEKNAE